MIEIEFDRAKNEANIAKYGIDLASTQDFDFETALVRIDTRQSYSETRYVATGYLGERLHVLVFTRRAARVRVIGLRKANRREERQYREKA
jgi:hypothetical protein